MRKRISILGLCACAAFLAGCAEERWQKDSATDADFAAVKASCADKALARFPVELRQKRIGDERMTPLAARCSGSGPTLRCVTTGGQYVPPTYAAEDENERAREAAVRDCLIKNGWHR